MDKKIYILLGASGSGKTTIGNYIRSFGIPEVLTHTTRPIRENEENGVQYYFVTKQEWDKLDKLEESVYSGNYYALSRDEVLGKLRENDRVYMILDIHGTNCIKAAFPELVKVIYVHTSLENLRGRMLERGDSVENIEKRLKNAVESGELNYHEHADYILENESLEQTLEQVKKILDR